MPIPRVISKSSEQVKTKRGLPSSSKGTVVGNGNEPSIGDAQTYRSPSNFSMKRKRIKNSTVKGMNTGDKISVEKNDEINISKPRVGNFNTRKTPDESEGELTNTDQKDEEDKNSRSKRRSTRFRPIDPTKKLVIIWPQDDLVKIFGCPVELSDVRLITDTDDTKPIHGSDHLGGSDLRLPIGYESGPEDRDVTTGSEGLKSEIPAPNYAIVSSSAPLPSKGSVKNGLPHPRDSKKRQIDDAVGTMNSKSRGGKPSTSHQPPDKQPDLMKLKRLSRSLQSAVVYGDKGKRESGVRFMSRKDGAVSERKEAKTVMSHTPYRPVEMGSLVVGSDYCDYEADSEDERFLASLVETQKRGRQRVVDPISVTAAAHRKKKPAHSQAGPDAETAENDVSSPQGLGGLVSIQLFERMVEALETEFELRGHWSAPETEMERLIGGTALALEQTNTAVSRLLSGLKLWDEHRSLEEDPVLTVAGGDGKGKQIKGKRKGATALSKNGALLKAVTSEFRKAQKLMQGVVPALSQTAESLSTSSSFPDLNPRFSLPFEHLVSEVLGSVPKTADGGGPGDGPPSNKTAVTGLLDEVEAVDILRAVLSSHQLDAPPQSPPEPQKVMGQKKRKRSLASTSDCALAANVNSAAAILEILPEIYRYWLQKRSARRVSLLRCFHRHLLSGWSFRDTVPPPWPRSSVDAANAPETGAASHISAIIDAREKLMKQHFEADKALTLAEQIKKRELKKSELLNFMISSSSGGTVGNENRIVHTINAIDGFEVDDDFDPKNKGYFADALRTQPSPSIIAEFLLPFMPLDIGDETLSITTSQNEPAGVKREVKSLNESTSKRAADFQSIPRRGRPKLSTGSCQEVRVNAERIRDRRGSRSG